MAGSNGRCHDNLFIKGNVKLICKILDELPAHKNRYKVDAREYARLLMDIKPTERYTLTTKESKNAYDLLAGIQFLWRRHGHPEWRCKETHGLHYTLLFERKEED